MWCLFARANPFLPVNNLFILYSREKKYIIHKPNIKQLFN